MIKLTGRTDTADTAEDTLTLPYADRQKSRQRVRLDTGRDAGVFLRPGAVLRDGDVLCSEDGVRVRIRAAPETVSTAETADPRLFARACYHLGNRHVALQIGEGWLRYRHDHVLNDMLRGLGLAVRVEEAPFEPEVGAYGAHASHHAHGG